PTGGTTGQLCPQLRECERGAGNSHLQVRKAVFGAVRLRQENRHLQSVATSVSLPQPASALVVRNLRMLNMGLYFEACGMKSYTPVGRIVYHAAGALSSERMVKRVRYHSGGREAGGCADVV
ncbi:unnamed protein product, partial [Ectocarpus sp. 13 AM-2016]